ncbi:MAG: 23S rRNA pseudouridine(1911/1915/1917) synthase RluD [Pseudomonadota bacterium]
MTEQAKMTAIIPDDHCGLRLDKSLAMVFPEYSRARLQNWIANNHVIVDGNFKASKYKVAGGEHIELIANLEDQNLESAPEDIPLDILYEDEHILIINKSVGLVVHPGAGNHTGTMLNALLHHSDQQAALPRAGIVHRLDKDTSGLMVVAKSLQAHSALVDQLQQHIVGRYYYAIVRGQMISGGTFDEPIGRHPTERTKMAVSDKGKSACTHYKIIEKFKRHTWVEAHLETGRTHQIRVHFAAHKFPLVGDAVYAPRVQRVANVPAELNEVLCNFPRQALHAFRLVLQHPITGNEMQWKTPIPQDMQGLIEKLRLYSS